MKLVLSFLFALFFACGVLSAPTQQKSKRSFKVERVRRGGDAIHGPAALRKAYQKYGIVPSDLGLDLVDFEPVVAKHASTNNKVTEPDQTGAVSAAAVQGDAAFVSPVIIGGQKIVMNFDTGSADFWVMNSRLSKKDVESRTIFHPSNSTTFKDLNGATFNISYGDASYASGSVGMETVDIGGAVVESQAIGLPTTVSSSFLEDAYSNGLVGLGFSSLNTVKPDRQKTFFDNVAPSLDEPVLTALLKSDAVGEYEFGVIDDKKYTGDIANVSIDSSNGFWQFDTTHFAVGNGSLQSIDDKTTSIADTGTSLMLLKDELVDAYYKQVEGAVYASSASGYIFPCNASLPSMSIGLGPKHLATVPGHLISFSEVGVNKTTGGKVCYGGVQSNHGTSMQILGDVFLKAFFVIFDMRGPSLGIASTK